MRIMHPAKYVCRVSSFSYPPRFCKPMSTCCENGLQVAGRTIELQFGSHSLAVVKQWRPESTMSRISIFPSVFPEHFQWRSSVCTLYTERNICGGAAPPPPPVLPPPSSFLPFFQCQTMTVRRRRTASMALRARARGICPTLLGFLPPRQRRHLRPRDREWNGASLKAFCVIYSAFNATILRFITKETQQMNFEFSIFRDICAIPPK